MEFPNKINKIYQKNMMIKAVAELNTESEILRLGVAENVICMSYME